MKNIKVMMIFVSILFFFPFVVMAEEANVKIDDVTLESSTDGVEVLSEPKITGLNIGFGVEFSEVGDKVVYKAVFNNQDNEDYSLKLPESKDDEYVSYEYTFDDNSSVLKANSKKSLMITVEYKKEVPDDVLVNGKYQKSNEVKLVLLNSKGDNVVVANPKTGQSILFFIIVGIVIIGSAIVAYRNHKTAKNCMFLLLTGLLIIPMSIHALKELSISIHSDVEIVKIKDFCVIDHMNNENSQVLPSGMPALIYEYKTGTTFGEYLNNNSISTSTGIDLDLDSSFIQDSSDDSCGKNIILFYTNSDMENMYGGSGSFAGVFEDGDSIIQDSSVGCYFVSNNVCYGQP